MMLRHLATAALTFCVSIGVVAGPAQMDDEIIMANGVRYEVNIQQRIRSDLRRRPAFGYWGAAMPRPVSCLASLTVLRGKQSIPVPAKLYLDLCSVNRLWLEERKGTMVAVLDGGDASEGFRAEFVFIGARLAERSVRDGESAKVG